MGRSEIYLNRARAYATAAAAMEEPGQRATLLQKAQHWRDMADLASRHEGATTTERAKSRDDEPLR